MTPLFKITNACTRMKVDTRTIMKHYYDKKAPLLLVWRQYFADASKHLLQNHWCLIKREVQCKSDKFSTKSSLETNEHKVESYYSFLNAMLILVSVTIFGLR